MPADFALASSLTEEFLRISREQLRERPHRIEGCLRRLSDEQIWGRQHDVENAIGNLVLHLCGSLRAWIVAGVGGQPIDRDRDAEFARRDPMPAEELIALLNRTIAEAEGVLARMTPEDLARERFIRDGHFTALHAIYHAVEHFAEHTGQIIWATKRMTGEDLRFERYAGKGTTSRF